MLCLDIFCCIFKVYIYIIFIGYLKKKKKNEIVIVLDTYHSISEEYEEGENRWKRGIGQVRKKY